MSSSLRRVVLLDSVSIRHLRPAEPMKTSTFLPHFSMRRSNYHTLPWPPTCQRIDSIQRSPARGMATRQLSACAARAKWQAVVFPAAAAAAATTTTTGTVAVFGSSMGLTGRRHIAVGTRPRYAPPSPLDSDDLQPTSTPSAKNSSATAADRPEAKTQDKQDATNAATAKGPIPEPSFFDESDDLGMMFHSRRRTLTSKAALEPRLRCTELNEKGDILLVDSEFKKSELIAKYGLLPRDLRKIDSSNLPHILVRPSAILINLLHLKVLIKCDRVLLFDVYGSTASFPQSAFVEDLQQKLRHRNGAGTLPYEFRALEAVLLSVCTALESDFEMVRDPIIHVLSELEDNIDRNSLRALLILSKQLNTFEQKAKLVRDAIEELLEADDDLAAMYLTEKAQNVYRSENDHTEIEMLLESYHKLCDEIVQEAGNLVSSIRFTEDIVRAILDANRNSMMLLELKYSIGAVGLAIGTFLAGLYGMNLENFIEETRWGFGAVTIVSTVASLAACFYGLVRLKRLQRIRIYEKPAAGGTGTASGSAGGLQDAKWYQDETPVRLLEARNREKLRSLNQLKRESSQRLRDKKWSLARWLEGGTWWRRP